MYSRPRENTSAQKETPTFSVNTKFITPEEAMNRLTVLRFKLKRRLENLGIENLTINLSSIEEWIKAHLETGADVNRSKLSRIFEDIERQVDKIMIKRLRRK